VHCHTTETCDRRRSVANRIEPIAARMPTAAVRSTPHKCPCSDLLLSTSSSQRAVEEGRRGTHRGAASRMSALRVRTALTGTLRGAHGSAPAADVRRSRAWDGRSRGPTVATAGRTPRGCSRLGQRRQAPAPSSRIAAIPSSA